MRKIGWVLLLSLSCYSGRTQDAKIRGRVEGGGEGWVFLAGFEGNRYLVWDSVWSVDGGFSFAMEEARPPGLYRLLFPDHARMVPMNQRQAEFLFNREVLDLHIAMGNGSVSLLADGSLENLIYREFQEMERGLEDRIASVYPLLGPDGEPGAIRLYENLQRERTAFLDSLIDLYPGLLVSRWMDASRSPFLPGGMTHARRLDTLRICFFDGAGLDDPLLLHTPVYFYKMIDYLALVESGRGRGDASGPDYREAVDRIMVNVGGDPYLHAWAVETLLHWFEDRDLEEPQFYVWETYADEHCVSDVAALVEERMRANEAMEPGKRVPDVMFRDVTGVNHRLSTLGHSRVLVLFWASTCPHCLDMLPHLVEWMEEANPDLLLVAVSIDADAANLEAYLEKWPLPGIVVHEEGGWLGRMASDFRVYATPTLFLLDGEGVILDRPASLRQLQRSLR
ncbi:MAG: TlpA disulfide reductase family protein [Bacteroidales bacterium]